LGIRCGATSDEVKKARKELALKYHPDKNKDISAHTIMCNVRAPLGLMYITNTILILITDSEGI